MNALTSTILWMSVQVTVFSALGCVLFLMLRRRGPRTGATCTAIVLGLTLILAIGAVSPWPRWSFRSLHPTASVQPKPVEIAAASPADSQVVASIPDTTAKDASATMLSVWWSTAMDFLQLASTQTPAEINAFSVWQAWLPILLLMGVGMCLIRLAIGIWAVRRLRARSQPIVDDGLMATAREMAHALGMQDVAVRQSRTSLQPAIHLCESPLLRSAVTIGWRRPLLLLPCDWRSWTETERRAVLAHELCAHRPARLCNRLDLRDSPPQFISISRSCCG